VKSAAWCLFPVDQTMRPNRQRGVALITAVLVVAIAAIIATSMMSRQNFDTQRTGNIIYRDQAIDYALGAEDWAVIELRRDAKLNSFDHLNEIWAYDLPPLPIEGGFINGRVQDLQGRFNLNSVLDPLQAERFSRLCEALGVEPDFIPALQDWIDDDTEVREYGAEDESYTVLDPPYRTANRLLADASELLLVKGVSVEDYNNLLFYISALPGNGAINVNTAAPQVLQSLTRDVALPDMARIARLRADKPYEAVDVFVADAAFAGKEIKEDYLTVSSQYFLLTADVILGEVPLTMQSVLYRTPQGAITVVNRRFGPPRERLLTETGGSFGAGN
jgi:general secretion pathway protein K